VDVVADGIAWLDIQRKAHMAREVIFVRADKDVSILATVGRTTFEQSDEGGMLISFRSRDFILSREDLVIDDVEVFPQAGDKFVVGDTTWEVMSANPCDGDTLDTMLRVHTKRVRS